MSVCPADLFGKNPNSKESIATYSHNAEEYDQWFEGEFLPILQAEFSSIKEALRRLFAHDAPFNQLEIGIGTGRFALHVKQCAHPNCRIFGLEPAEGMAHMCRSAFAKCSANLTLVEKKAEELNRACFDETQMDCVMFVTTLGFLEDNYLVLNRIRQEVLAPRGCVCVAFINGETAWGKEYLQVTKDDKFYMNGTCVLNLSNVIQLFQRTGFILDESACFQTLIQQDESSVLDLEALVRDPINNPALTVVPGYGKGMWSVLTFRAPE